jgi:hypothetical protein
MLERIRQFATPDGTFQSQGTWLRQQGEMRLAPDRPWLPFKAEQWLPGDGIDFRWEAQVRMALLLRARVVDCFEGGTRKLIAKLLGLIPVVRSQVRPPTGAKPFVAWRS